MAATAVIAPVPVLSPEIKPPAWPANDHPGAASITWDSRGLRIEAANSSLKQILDEVSTTIGMKIQGLGDDQRVFGAYGPGQPREVLSQLLQGSGYNILMIGDQGQGAPRQILLSSRNTTESSNTVNKNVPSSHDEDDAEPEEQAQPSTPPAQSNPGVINPRPQQQISDPMHPDRQPQQQDQQQQPPNN